MNKKPNGYWTKEKCQEEALKYKTRTEFKSFSRSAYNVAYKKNFLDEICSHILKRNRKPNGYWTKEKCQEEALKYKSKTDFKKSEKGAYKKATQNKWINDICSHMKSDRKPNGYWTKEKCQEEALKYKTKANFYNQNSSAYSKALKNKWLKNICLHMTTNINDSKRCIYAHIFSDNCVYIGLTNNFNRRKNKHFKSHKSSVFKHMKKTNLIPKVIQLTDYLNVKIAQEKESYFVNYFKENDWNLLNIIKTGSIGSNIIMWTKEKCEIEALKYDTRSEFQKKLPGAYTSALKNKWLDEICSHMIQLKNHWTKEECQNEALKYKIKINFYNKNNSAYKKASKEKWLVEICSHMIPFRKSNGYWTKENCHLEALKYPKKINFLKKSHSAYEKARQNKWLVEICSHMI